MRPNRQKQWGPRISRYHSKDAPKGTRQTTILAPSGTWVLGKTIGVGSVAKVKLAKRIESREQVAVKIIPRPGADIRRQGSLDRERADHLKELQTGREAAIVMLLDHPYICRVKDIVRTNSHWYMLFEYVKGGQMLDYIISHGKLKENRVRKFARQIASALDYCHRNSIVHRDLKVENILINKLGDIKIIDFGLSDFFDRRGHLKRFCGNSYFPAPELLQARPYVGPEVDIWNFGIILYILVCGKVPFDDQTVPGLHAKIKKGVVEDYPRCLTIDCKDLIDRMLVTDSEQRINLLEIMNHPWMTEGFVGPPENHLPRRAPLQLPSDPEVIRCMSGLGFGSSEAITAQLTKEIESDEYQSAARLYLEMSAVQSPSIEKKRTFRFNFYKSRSPTTIGDIPTNPATRALHIGIDPFNAFHPLISAYYLVLEKQERDREAHDTTPSDSHSEKHSSISQSGYFSACILKYLGM